MSRSKLITIIAMVVAVLIWSSSYVFIRMGVAVFSPGAFALYRYLISSLLLVFVYIPIKNKKIPNFKEGLYIFSIGVIGIGVYIIALNLGEVKVSASIASFIIGLSPIVSLLWLSFINNEAVSSKIWLGVVISVMGLLIILLSKQQENSLDWHIVFILIAMLTAGYYNVAQKPLLLKYKPMEVTAFTVWSATLVLCIFFPQLIHELPKTNWHDSISPVYLGIVSGFIGYSLWTIALSGEIPVSKLVMSFYALPLCSTLIGWVLLGEMPAMFSLIGGCVAMLGAYVATQR